MLQEQVDLVAGDFNGAPWRRQSGSDHRPISILEEAFAKTSLPIPLGPTQLWNQVVCQANGLAYADSYSHLGPKPSGIFECTVLSKSLTTRLASSAQIRAATTKCGSTSSTLMHDWSIANPRMTNLVDHFRVRGTRRTITVKKGGHLGES